MYQMPHSIATRKFNENEIRDKMSNLKITENDNVVTTSYFNRVINETKVSNRYGVFDFGTFVRQILTPLQEYFEPQHYLLRINGGFQELRLVGEEITIGKDRFWKMMNILSSSDKTRALQINSGLIRLICTNGAIAADKDEYTGFRTKHYSNSVPEKVEYFLTKFPELIENFGRQIDTIDSILSFKPVSLKDFANRIAIKEDGEKMPSMITNLKLLTKTLMYSATDKLDTRNLPYEQKRLLWYPDRLLNKNELQDLIVPAYQLFNCYIEAFREKDSGNIRKETSRVFKVLSDINKS